MSAGLVYLVGAGPGDPELITVRGLRALQAADVVVYDRLASPALLAQARADAELIDVGKRCGAHGRKQGDISTLLADLALQGRTVCRLKGGDPFVFGRGGEEAEVLEAAGVGFEVVPGITSGIAAAAYAGIPVTHRDHAGSVALVTGHEAPGKDGPAVDWDRMAHAAETLLIYMGVEGLGQTAERLVAAGRPAGTPVAVIRWGTRAEQVTVTGTLADIAERVTAAGISSPAMIVVGSVAGLRERLAWAERRPLHGHRVLVARASGAAPGPVGPVEELRRLGAEVWEWPVDRPALAPLLHAALAEGGVQTVAFPDAAAVAGLIRHLGGVSALAGLSVICADAATAGAAARAGLSAGPAAAGPMRAGA